MVKQRDIAVAIILYFVTCGIYGIYWLIVLNDEINLVTGNTGDTSGGMVFLFNLITCGIYGYYWMYKAGNKLDDLDVRNGRASQSRGLIYIILTFFGLGIVSYALMQDTLNKNIPTSVE